MSNRLYIGNLALDISEDALSNAFSRFGEVVEIKIVMDRDTGRSRGYAFVSMADAHSARTARTEMDGSMLEGRAVRVKEAEARKGGGMRSQPRSRS